MSNTDSRPLADLFFRSHQEQVMELESVMAQNSRPTPVNPTYLIQVPANDAISGASDWSRRQMPAHTVEPRIPPIQRSALMPPPPTPTGYRNVVQQPVNTMAPVPLENPSASVDFSLPQCLA